MSSRSVTGGAREHRHGPSGFDEHYAELFGSRWPTLRAALLGRQERAVSRCVRENAFASLVGWRARLGPAEPLPIAGCQRVLAEAPWAERDEQGLIASYAMDPASVVAARALPLEGAQEVLDLCAAPGGKSLILAERAAMHARLVLNERSPERRTRLKKVLSDYLPADVRARITVTGYDGRSFGMRRPSSFDAVLLDAPCSSEEHVLSDPSALARWSSTRSERLSRDQYALLAAALLALRPGGYVLYATCALSPLENDGVVQRLLERGRHGARLESVQADLGSATELGWQILPDEDCCGPMYFALLRREV